MTALDHPDAQHETTDTALGSLTRLHITPFTPDLYQTLVPTASRESARCVSFHQIETFPESAYGYISLPEAEAQRLKRLNGAFLKGKKILVADARAEKWMIAGNMDIGNSGNLRKSSSKRQKTKIPNRDNVIPGYELPKTRHVKRGWAVTATAKSSNLGKKRDSQAKSDDISKSDVIFRTSVPPNRRSITPKTNKADKVAEKSERKAIEVKAKGHKRLHSRQSVANNKVVSQYVDGQGWVNEDGVTVEAHIMKKQKTDNPPSSPGRDSANQGERIISKTGEQSVLLDEPASFNGETMSGQISQLSVEECRKEKISASMSMSPKTEDHLVTRRSSLATKNPSKVQKQRQVSFALCEEDLAADSDPNPNEEPKSAADHEVHPLESIFKHSKSADKGSKLAPIQTSFSFFEDNELDNEDVHEPPQTPFTIQDRRYRRIRSPAPTPDTAAINRRVDWPWTEGNAHPVNNEESKKTMPIGDTEHNTEFEENESFEAQGSDKGETNKGNKKDTAESEFAKWFWENRGENNRAWRRRRREAMKAERQRQNKRFSRHV